MPRKPKTARKGTMPRDVLVVEDDAILGMAIEQALLDAGVETVSLCPSASSTLEQLREGKPDVVLIDVHLADSDNGWGIAEMVDAIGSDAPRIIFQTGSPDDIPEDVAKLGPVLSKPYDASELIELVREQQKGGLLSALRLG